MQKEDFLLQYNISNVNLEEAKIGWDELELIVKEYEKIDFMEAVRKVCDLTGQKVEGFEKVIKKTEIPKDKEVL